MKACVQTKRSCSLKREEQHNKRASSSSIAILCQPPVRANCSNSLPVSEEFCCTQATTKSELESERERREKNEERKRNNDCVTTRRENSFKKQHLCVIFKSAKCFALGRRKNELFTLLKIFKLKTLGEEPRAQVSLILSPSSLANLTQSLKFAPEKCCHCSCCIQLKGNGNYKTPSAQPKRIYSKPACLN